MSIPTNPVSVGNATKKSDYDALYNGTVLANTGGTPGGAQSIPGDKTFEDNLDVDGNTTLDDTEITGTLDVSSDIISGEGTGAVGLTTNDGGGNANVTFNHANRIPDQDGNSGRIDFNTDATTYPTMSFGLAANVTKGAWVSLDDYFQIGTAGMKIPQSIQVNPTTDYGETLTGWDRVWIGGSNSLSYSDSNCVLLVMLSYSSGGQVAYTSLVSRGGTGTAYGVYAVNATTSAYITFTGSLMTPSLYYIRAIYRMIR